jgi:large subunit ribosomal protein L10e
MFKFPGRQRVIVSRKFGFTKYSKTDYHQLEKEGRIIPDGVNIKVKTDHGPLSRLALFK